MVICFTGNELRQNRPNIDGLDFVLLSIFFEVSEN